MSRRTVRDAWRTEVLRSPLIGEACRVLLLHMATVETVTTKGGHPMTDAGRIKVSREELAETLGVKPQRITDRIAEATRKGLLRKAGGGHNGQTAIYAAQVQGPRKGTGRTDTYFGPESLAELVKVSVSQVPTRTAEPIPTPAVAEQIGIGRTDAIRARASKNNREQEPAPDGSGEERDQDVALQAGAYGSWQPLGSNCAVAENSRTEAEERGRALREAVLGRKAS